MNTLNIQQQLNIAESVSTELITKLYETAVSIPLPNEGEEDAAYLAGRLEVVNAYENHVKYLAGNISGVPNPTGRFLDLRIDVAGSLYISFEDQEVERVLKANNASSDGVGITYADAASFVIPHECFKNNTTITSFDEFKYFTASGSYSSNYIGNRFNGCTNLSSIDLTLVTKLGQNDIRNTAITTINAPNLEGFTREYGQGVFAYNSSLQEVQSLGSITYIPAYAFQYCTSLTSVNLPSTLTEIRTYAFLYCSSLSQLSIPSSVTKIGEGAFRNMNESLVIPISDLLNIITIEGNRDTSLFLEGHSNSHIRRNLVGELSLPNLLTLGDKVFMSQGSITKVNLPGLISLNGQGTFALCTALTEVIDLGNITEITGDFKYTEYGTFAECTNLEKVTLPDTLTNLPSSMFNGCTKLKNVNIPTSLLYYDAGSLFRNCSLDSVLVFNNNLTKRTRMRGVFPETSSYSWFGNFKTSLFENCTAKGVYMKNQQVFKTYVMNDGDYNSIHSHISVLCINDSHPDWNFAESITTDVMYLKNIQSISPLAFMKALINVLIINNTTPPSLEPLYDDNNIVNAILGKTYAVNQLGSSVDLTDPFATASINTIYVPDAAVNTYKADPHFANWISKIQPLSDCPRITLTEAEEGTATGVIEAYM